MRHCLESDLGDIVEPVMSLSFVSSQQDGVPWRPLLVLVPAHQHQVEHIRVLAQNALAVPDVQHQLSDVDRLHVTASNSTH